MTAINEIKPRTEFGYLWVQNQGESDSRGAARYWCVCRAPGCGKRLLVKGQKLRHGQRSCGCRRSVPPIAFSFHATTKFRVVPCNKPDQCAFCDLRLPLVDEDGHPPEPLRKK